MSLEKHVLGWKRGAAWSRKLLDEKLPELLRANAKSARRAIEFWHRDLWDPAIATPGKAATQLAGLPRVAGAAVLEENERLPLEGPVSFGVLGLVDLGNALECVGCPLPPESWSTLRSWLGRIGVSREDERLHYNWTTGFAALALDDRITYARFAGYRGGVSPVPDSSLPGPPRGRFPFEPGQSFQFNLQGLLAYLAGAVENGATEADVIPAWEDLLTSYPVLREANTIDQGTLLWIARTVFHRIGGHPVGEVAQRLHDSAWHLAGLEP